MLVGEEEEGRYGCQWHVRQRIRNVANEAPFGAAGAGALRGGATARGCCDDISDYWNSYSYDVVVVCC